MLNKGDEVWVDGYVTEDGQNIKVFCSGTVLETPVSRARTVLVRLDNYYGEVVDKKVLIKFIRGL